MNGRVLVVGDAAHLASPRTAAGAHTAMLDALALREALKAAGGNVDAALRAYDADAVNRAQALHARSLQVGRDFVPRGGVMTKLPMECDLYGR